MKSEDHEDKKMDYVNSEDHEDKNMEQHKENNLVCKVCLDNKVMYAFVGCGHLCLCSTCFDKVNKCPLCRKISDRKRIYY